MKKKITRRKKSTAEQSVFEPQTSLSISEQESVPVQPPLPPRRLITPIQLAGIGVLVVALVVLYAVKNGYILAAVVNGKPIFRWNLHAVLVQRFGQQTLDRMVMEQLISDEASKANVAVTQEDIDKRENEILRKFGTSITIEDFLRIQGMQKNEFDKEIKLELEMQRVLTKDLSITDNDIDGFIATNSLKLVATEPASLREEAKQAIIDQKVAEQFDDWLQALREKASVQKFL